MQYQTKCLLVTIKLNLVPCICSDKNYFTSFFKKPSLQGKLITFSGSFYLRVWQSPISSKMGSLQFYKHTFKFTPLIVVSECIAQLLLFNPQNLRTIHDVHVNKSKCIEFTVFVFQYDLTH